MKDQVRDFWNADPCGKRFAHYPVGTREFFEESEEYRYRVQPWLPRVAEFNEHWGDKVLEIGCGMGTDALQFARGGANVTVVDLTESAIDITRKRFRMYGFPLTARVADAEALPFPDNTFDVVYSFGVLHHTPDTAKALREAVRVLKPGGRLIVMLYNKHSLLALVGSLIYGRGEWVRLWDGPGNPLGKSYSKREVREMVPIRVEFETVEFIHRRWPMWVNGLWQLVTEGWGAYLIVKGYK